MEFLHAGLVGLAALAAVPILLHLLHRPKPKERPFPSLLFLRKCARKSRRLARIKNLLLMAMRALAVAGMAIAVARPRLPGTAEVRGGGLAVAIVLDDSYRMGYRDGGRPRFEEARRRALDLLASLPSGTDCALVRASGESTDLLPDPSLPRAELLRAQPGDFSSHLLPAILDAARTLEEAKAKRREIHVFTDLTRSAWTGGSTANLRALDGIRVAMHDVGKEGSVNAAVTKVDLTPTSPRAGRPVEIAATVAGWGRAGPTVVALNVKDRVEEKTVSLADGGSAVVRFRWTPESEGVLHGTVSLRTPDPLEADDARHFATPLGDPIRLLVVDADADAPYLSYALAPPRLRDKAPVVVTTTADLGHVGGVLLGGSAGIAKESLGRLADFVAGGGGLAAFASGGAESLSTVGLYPAVEGVTDVPARLAPGSSDHEIVRRFRAGRNGDLAAATFARRLRVKTDARWRPVFRFDDGIPAALEASSGRGRLLAFSFALDATDLPKFPCFVPLVHETARYLVGSARPSLDFDAGVPVVVPLPSPPLEPSFVLVELGTGRREERLADPSVAALSVARSLPPGAYAIERNDGRRAFSVNLDPSGSDPTRVALEELSRLLPGVRLSFASATATAHEIRTARRGRELAIFALLAVAGFLLIELWLASRS